MPANLVVGTPRLLGSFSGNQDENWIAINPTNPNNLAAVTVDEGSLISGVRFFFSLNGGQTWSSRLIATGGDGLGQLGVSDGKVLFDRFGNLYLTYLDVNPTSGVISLDVVISTNGGVSFGPLTPGGSIIVAADDATTGVDQPTLAAGPNSLWLTFARVPTGGTGAGAGVYAVGAPILSAGSVGAFGTPVLVAPAGNFGDIAVSPGSGLNIGPLAPVVVTYQNPFGPLGPTGIFTATDPDGLGPQPFGAPVMVTPTNVAGFESIPAQNNRTVDAEPNLAYDMSGGANRGRLYLVYSDSTGLGSNDLDTFLRFSDDDGATWSARVRVNDDSTTNSQFNPAIAVDPTTGFVAVSWYDARNSPGNDSAQPFVAASLNGGQTFLPNAAAVPGLSTAGNANSGLDYGDYSSIAFYNGVIRTIYSDNSGAIAGNQSLPSFDVGTTSITINTAPPPPPPTPLKGMMIVAPGPGALPYISVIDPNSRGLVRLIRAFDPSFRGGVRVATGDVNADGVPDIIAAAGPGGGPVVRVFDGIDGFMIEQFFAYDPRFAGGVYVAAADINKNGRSIIITGADAGGGPHVKLFSSQTGQTLRSFFAFAPTFRGGVRVAAGDVNGDGVPDIIAATGPGTPSAVEAFSGRNNQLIRYFLPFGASYVGGVFVAAGNLNGDKAAEFVVSTGPGAVPIVKAFNGLNLGPVFSFFAFPVPSPLANLGFGHDTFSNSGVRIALGDFNGDGIADVLAAPASGRPGLVRLFSGSSLGVLSSVQAFDPSFLGGVFVAAG